MYEGTLYGHWEAIVTLQQMLVLCNSDGVIDMTPQAMSARTSIPLEIITKGLKTLAEPDPYTRTPGEEGRRIVLLDEHRPWGWVIVNYRKYRDMKSRLDKLEADRERIAEKRRQNKGVADSRGESQLVAEVAHAATATATATAIKDKGKGPRAARAPARRPGWDYAPSAEVIEWVKQQGHEAYLQLHVEKFRDTCATQARKPYTEDGLDAAFRNCVRDDWGHVRRQAKDAERRGEQPAAINGRWWKSDDGIYGKATELRVVRDFNEPWPHFKARVFVAAGEGPWIDERDGTTMRFVKEIREHAAGA